jgi:hypothetical protein
MEASLSIKPHTNIKVVLFRATIIFTVVLGLLLSTTAVAVYAGAKSGELKTKVVEPVQKTVAYINTSLKDEYNPPAKPRPSLVPIPDDGLNTKTTITNTNTVIINGRVVSRNGQPVATPKPVPVRTPAPTSVPVQYKSTLQSDEEWQKMVDAQHAAYEQRVEAQKQNSQDWYNTQVQKSQDWYNTQVQQSQAEMDAFKKQAEENQAKFLQNAGQ